MGLRTEHSSKRPYDQFDADLSSSCPQQSEMGVGLDELWQSAADAESEVDGHSQRALIGCRDQGEAETDVTGSSRQLHPGERYFLDPRDFNYTQHEASPQKKAHISATRGFSTINNDASSLRPKVLHPTSCIINHKGSPAELPDITPSRALHLSFSNGTQLVKPNPSLPPSSRPTFTQLSTDGQQGMKVLFLIDHATKGDAIHHSISAYIHSDSSEMKLLVAKYQKDRSHLQSRYFAKARIICAQLTSRPKFVTLDEKGGNRDKRLEYFRKNCTKAHLATLYGHLGSAVDIPRILSARTLNDKAFMDLMIQVFVHSMEDLWCFEFKPSKANSSAKLEKESREEIYNRFKVLTDRVDGLPAAKVMPGYFEIPLKAAFPRYVLFHRGPKLLKWERQ